MAPCKSLDLDLGLGLGFWFFFVYEWVLQICSKEWYRIDVGEERRASRSSSMDEVAEGRMTLADEVDALADDVTAPFESKFAPSDMRQLALVAHNHMKPAMKEFIETYSEILQNFRITGNQTTMHVCKTLWGEDNPKIEYGLTCTAGPLGGDAQVAALICTQDLGALIFFVDPLSAHPHQSDIDSLIRLANCGNVIVCLNPTSAMSMMHVMKGALQKGSRGMVPSFFETLESPAVAEYKVQQNAALRAVVSGTTPAPMRMLTAVPSAYFLNTHDSDVDVPAAPKHVHRASNLTGLAKPKKKKGALKKLGKSFRRLASGDSR